MAAYATRQLELASRPFQQRSSRTEPTTSNGYTAGSSLLDALIDQIAECVAARLAGDGGLSLVSESHDADEWLDSRHAAAYLGIHRDTLRKLAAERAIPAEQDGPNCKLYFRRSDLDAWRRSGGRPRHLASTLAGTA
ncbi:MAG: helix-turn-helix domain-containing protein [Solirubrobacteraceae bacterium]